MMKAGNTFLNRGLSILLMITAFVACKKDTVQKNQHNGLHAVTLSVPAHFPSVQADADNPLTAEGIELGRLLFYERRLSGSNGVSCASCHHQDLAFSDGVALSNLGVSGVSLKRHAPVLFNLAWSDQGFFWDGGAKNLESQAFGPLTSADEMHQDLQQMEVKLKLIPDYVERFNLVFSDGIKAVNVVKALAQFERTLISGTSRYDQYLQGQITLSAIELQGLSLVNTKCSSCHQGVLFTDHGFHNNGLDATFSDAEEGLYQGRYRVTSNLRDMGKFKTPSLRNVMLTAPYMHDGRLKTIVEVLDHYSQGIQTSLTTDPLLYQNHGGPGILLSGDEKQAIIAFLSTLTDEKFISNKKLSKPD